MEVAIGAGALVAFCRAPIFYESSPDKTSLVLFFTALAFFALAVAVDRGSPRAWVAAGLAVGFGALGHALLLAFLPAAAAGLLLLQGAARKTLVCVAAYGLGACLGVAPATVHNAVRGGELELICSNGGIGLYLGNHAGNPTGLYTSPPFSRAEYSSELADFKSEAERRVGRPLGPGQVSAFWTRQALREMADQPLLTLTRFLRKVRWTVGEEEISDTRSFDFYLTQLRVLPRLPWGFGFVAALGLVGGCVSLRGRRVVLVPFVVAYWGALSLFFVYGRYRLPLLIPMAILGAGLTAWLPDVVRERRARAAALAASGAVLAAMLVFTPVLPAVPVSFFADYYNQGNRYLRLGRTDLAIAEYEKALTVRPGIHPAVTGVAITVADLEVRRGERDRAIALLRAVLQHRPGDAALTAKLAEMESAAGR
jgi:hypothetical protein